MIPTPSNGQKTVSDDIYNAYLRCYCYSLRILKHVFSLSFPARLKTRLDGVAPSRKAGGSRSKEDGKEK